MRPELAAAALFWLIGAGPALACSCIRLAPEGFRAQADVILHGRVLQVARAPDGGPQRLKVRVLHRVKGHSAGVITVETPPPGNSCAMPMRPGQGAEFLLSRRGGRFSTNPCLMLGSRTR